jgi:hypothetical protein
MIVQPEAAVTQGVMMDSNLNQPAKEKTARWPYFSRFPNPERMGVGLIVTGVGVVFLLDSLKLLSLSAALPFWPVVLIALGMVKLAYSRQSGGGIWGVMLMAAGGVLLATHFGWLEVSWRALWPLIVVGVGLSVVFKGMRGSASGSGRRNAPNVITDEEICLSLFMSGAESRVLSPAFKGGVVSLLMSGAELDLREAKLQGQARLMVDVMLGGLELRVPQGWQVVVQGDQFMGGIENKTAPAFDANPPQLIIDGRVMMGGIEVKN